MFNCFYPVPTLQMWNSVKSVLRAAPKMYKNVNTEYHSYIFTLALVVYCVNRSVGHLLSILKDFENLK